MTKHKMKIRKIKKIIKLIENKETGSAEELADKLNLSKRMTYLYLEQMKQDFKAPIKYDKQHQSYIFSEKGILNLDWIPKKN